MLMLRDLVFGLEVMMKWRGEVFVFVVVVNGLVCGSVGGELDVFIQCCNKSNGYFYMCVLGDLVEQGEKGWGGEEFIV